MLLQSIYPIVFFFINMSFINVDVGSRRSLTKTSLSPSMFFLEKLFWYAIFTPGKVKRSMFPNYASNLEELAIALPFSSVL